MELPEHLRELVERLGQALVDALATDPGCRRLTLEIQQEGFEVALMVEATVALHQREPNDTGRNPLDNESRQVNHSPLEMAQEWGQDQNGSQRPDWSEDDKAFLQTFRISLD